MVEPREAVLVGEGDAGAHFGDVGGRVVVVGIVEGGVEMGGEGGANGRFATARHAHDDVGEGHKISPLMVLGCYVMLKGEFAQIGGGLV